jgi:hypothetical protein
MDCIYQKLFFGLKLSGKLVKGAIFTPLLR